jgi:hypothetical protein
LISSSAQRRLPAAASLLAALAVVPHKAQAQSAWDAAPDALTAALSDFSA